MPRILTPLKKLGDFAFEQLIFFVTAKCNLSCAHCFYWESLNRIPDLELGEIERICASAPRFRSLLLSGGEPFLRKDLFQVLDLFHRMNGVTWFSIPTNGSPTARIAEGVEEFLETHPGLHLRINVSIDGTEEPHDRLRGMAGSWRRAVETLERLRELRPRRPDLSLGVTTVLTAGSLEDVRVLAARIHDEHRPDTHNIVAVRDGFRAGQDLKLESRELEEMETLNREVHARYLPFRGPEGSLSLHGLFDQAKNSVMLDAHFAKIRSGKDWDFPCVAGRVIAVLDADGTLRACEMRRPVLDLRARGFDLGGALRSPEMAAEVAKIARDRCFCTHGCFSLPSLERHVPTMLVRVPLRMLRARRKARAAR
jgi:MoaA/NifB/PqqE/SkfB family radical SAM enzyme